jgi:hypothetical protein
MCVVRAPLLILMGSCLGAPQRDWSFDFNACMVSIGPTAERQANCLTL